MVYTPAASFSNLYSPALFVRVSSETPEPNAPLSTCTTTPSTAAPSGSKTVPSSVARDACACMGTTARDAIDRNITTATVKIARTRDLFQILQWRVSTQRTQSAPRRRDGRLTGRAEHT